MNKKSLGVFIRFFKERNQEHNTDSKSQGIEFIIQERISIIKSFIEFPAIDGTKDGDNQGKDNKTDKISKGSSDYSL